MNITLTVEARAERRFREMQAAGRAVTLDEIAADIARAHGGVLRLGESETLGGLRADIVIAR